MKVKKKVSHIKRKSMEHDISEIYRLLNIETEDQRRVFERARLTPVKPVAYRLVTWLSGNCAKAGGEY
jgi:hypothetical protein